VLDASANSTQLNHTPRGTSPIRLELSTFLGEAQAVVLLRQNLPKANQGNKGRFLAIQMSKKIKIREFK